MSAIAQIVAHSPMNEPKMMGAEPLLRPKRPDFEYGPRRRGNMSVENRRSAIRELLTMERGADDVFETIASHVSAGADYLYVIDGAKERPDPCSRYQPSGVHGPSRVVASDFVWSDRGWSGIDLAELVLYELHAVPSRPRVRSRAIIPKLAHLRDLGITAIELMPSAVSGGSQLGVRRRFPLRGPERATADPRDCDAWSTSATVEGSRCMLDVVYNHLGPEGNYLADFGPYFSQRYKTPWGERINYDGPDSDPVRAYFRDNALALAHRFPRRWPALRRHSNHLRLGRAALSRRDQRRRSTSALASSVGACSSSPRAISTMFASSSPRSAMALASTHNGATTSTTQSRAAVTGNPARLFRGIQPAGRRRESNRAKASSTTGSTRPIAENTTASRRQASPGTNSACSCKTTIRSRNAWHGRRLSKIASPGRQRLAAAILFSHPGVPMLFMGQEYGETAPFDFFTSHSDADLVAAVRRGRAEEFRGVGLAHAPRSPRRSHVSGVEDGLVAPRARRTSANAPPLSRSHCPPKGPTWRSRADGKTSRWYDRARTRGG